MQPGNDPPGPALAELSARIGYEFGDWGLLERSLAHRSWCAETPGSISNERLEFLGDAVLGWAIADIVYHRYPVAEGQLTDLRKSVVNAIALAEVAQEIGLGDHVLLGRGEAAAGGAAKPSILSDAFEAVLGAVYLDGGADAAYAMVERLVRPRRVSMDNFEETNFASCHGHRLRCLLIVLNHGRRRSRLRGKVAVFEPLGQVLDGISHLTLREMTVPSHELSQSPVARL